MQIKGNLGRVDAEIKEESELYVHTISKDTLKTNVERLVANNVGCKESVSLWGGIKKKLFFFQKNSERGEEGSRRIRNFLIRKN